ncbi:MAG: DinB family protein [Chloroflexota bacterium]
MSQPEPHSDVAEPLAILRRTPDVLRALLYGLPDSWTDTRDTPDGWLPRDVVGHLISGELSNYLDRAKRIMEHGTSLAFDPFDRFEMIERDRAATLDELLDRFAALRAKSLAEFETMVSDVDLTKRGLHPAMGEVTLDQLLNTWAVHDLDHTVQVFAGLAGSHDADVGPWKQYLGILLRRTDPAAVPG